MPEPAGLQRTFQEVDQADYLPILVDAFLFQRRAKKLSAGSLKFYRCKLKDFLTWCEAQAIASVKQINPVELRRYLIFLEERHNPGGVHSYYRAIKAFFRWYEWKFEPEDWKNPIKKVEAPRVPEEILSPVTVETIEAMIETCRAGNYHGDRDRAMLLCLLDSGARAQEFLNLNLADVNLVTGEIHILKGKEGKFRAVFLGTKSRKAVRAYLKHRKPAGDSPLWATKEGKRLVYGSLLSPGIILSSIGGGFFQENSLCECLFWEGIMDTQITVQSNDLVIRTGRQLDQSPAAVYLAGLESAQSRATMRESLSLLAEILTGDPDPFSCNWAGLRFQHVAVLRSQLIETVSSKTGRIYGAAYVNKMLCALRGTLSAAFDLGQISAEDYQHAIRIKSVKGDTLPAGRELSPGEIEALMRSCENYPTPAGARDAALIAILYSAGLRRAEVVSLDLSDYDPSTGRLVVLGKRNKERTAYLINGGLLATGDWLAVRGAGSGPLFLPINKGGRIGTGRLTTQAVYNILEKRAEESGVSEFSPHDLRRTFVSDLLDAGADIATVSKMAGHASVTTTARYDRRPEQAKVKAAGRLHVPYRGRR